MSDLISREAVYMANEHLKPCSPKDVEDMISCIPSAQPEQKCGRWLITDAYPHNVYCSQCYKTFAQTHWAVWEDGTLPRNFCPNCGAKMEETNDSV